MWTLTCVSASFRMHLYDYISGNVAAPADQAALFQLQRSASPASNSTVVAGQALDFSEVATSNNIVTSYITLPALTAAAFLLTVAQNQRATFRWVAAPDGELMIPATANSGLANMPITSTAAVASWAYTVHWWE
jgi:hypothetical protein